jgi:hypothetical protein
MNSMDTRLRPLSSRHLLPCFLAVANSACLAAIPACTTTKTMKPATSIPTARESAGTTGRRPLRWTLCWALAGFGLGVVSASAYLLLGGEYFLFIPRWAYIVFYPGFFVGNAVYDWGLRQEASKVVGVLTVGLAYATLAVLARFAWFALKHRRQSAAARQESK